MKLLRKICLLSAALLIFCLATTANAAKTCRFTDVPNDYWAAADIEALAAGGLVNGYGNGKFGPENPLHIDHVATIICNALGHDVNNDTDYWAYEAVRYCRDELKCMPNRGEITGANYSVQCTREEAIAMLVMGLCVNDQPSDEALAEWDKADIPDYNKINPEYAEAILKAYQLGIVYGIDHEHTFNPTATFKRSHICAIMNRAGYNTKVEPPKAETPVTPPVVEKEEPTTEPDAPSAEPSTPTTNVTGKSLYETAKSWGVWTDVSTAGSADKRLRATDPIYGGVEVFFRDDGLIIITMNEANESAWIKGGNWVDANGKLVSTSLKQRDFKDENGKFVLSSGWSYDARQLVKRILEAELSKDAANETYQALLSVMKQEIWESPYYATPSALRWIDNRCMNIAVDDTNHIIGIYIAPIGERVYYDEILVGSGRTTKFHSVNGAVDNIPAMYELHRG